MLFCINCSFSMLHVCDAWPGTLTDEGLFCLLSSLKAMCVLSRVYFGIKWLCIKAAQSLRIGSGCWFTVTPEIFLPFSLLKCSCQNNEAGSAFWLKSTKLIYVWKKMYLFLLFMWIFVYLSQFVWLWRDMNNNNHFIGSFFFLCIFSYLFSQSHNVNV